MLDTDEKKACTRIWWLRRKIQRNAICRTFRISSWDDLSDLSRTRVLLANAATRTFNLANLNQAPKILSGYGHVWRGMVTTSVECCSIPQLIDSVYTWRTLRRPSMSRLPDAIRGPHLSHGYQHGGKRASPAVSSSQSLYRVRP